MKKIFLPVLAMVAVASCSQNDESSFTQNDREVRISSSIATRMIDNAWQATDSIGVYMVAADGDFAAATDGNVKYTTATTNGDFTSETPFYFPATGKVDLLAYYPYDTTTDVDAYKVDVADQTAPAKIDLMKAEAADVVMNPAAVNMTFKHKLARLVLTISEGDGLEAEDLKGLTVTLSGTNTTADYDLTAEDAAAISGADDVADITMLATINDEKVVTAAEAIVIPQDMSSAKISFVTTAYGTFETTLAIDSFAIGNEYLYKVKINRTGVSISSPTINPWGDGDEGDDNDLSAEFVPPSTELTLARVNERKIDEYEDRWVIVDTDDTAGVEDEFYDLTDAISAAHNDGREITVVFPNLKNMPDYAMYGSEVTHVELPKLESLGVYAFNDCDLLKSVKILGDCTIEAYAFQDCESLTSIDLSGVTEIGDSAFKSCNSLVCVKNLGACTIDPLAFRDCTKLSSIDLSKVTEIKNEAFMDCDSLSSIDLSGVTEIGQNAFYDCESLTSVKNVGACAIGAYAFRDCTKLSSIDLSKVTKISGFAFLDCESLSYVDLSAVTAIGSNAFKGCNSLTTLDNIGKGNPGGDLKMDPPLTDDTNAAKMTLNFYCGAIDPWSTNITNLVVAEDNNTISWTNKYDWQDYTQQFLKIF